MIFIWPESLSFRDRAIEIARAVGGRLTEGEPESGFVLKLSAAGLELLSFEPGKKSAGGILVDFTSGPMKQLVRSATKGQPLARAIGHSKRNPSVVDATAGLGKDTLFLAAIGCEVTAVERDPVIFSLLRDGFERGLTDADIGPLLKERVRLIQGDAAGYLSGIQENERPDVVYLDPMFPESKKSALPKKEMQIFRAFLKGAADERALLDFALTIARDRVVVKRPSWAEPLKPEPSTRFEGKLVTYDSYLSSAHDPRYK